MFAPNEYGDVHGSLSAMVAELSVSGAYLPGFTAEVDKDNQKLIVRFNQNHPQRVWGKIFETFNDLVFPQLRIADVDYDITKNERIHWLDISHEMRYNMEWHVDATHENAAKIRKATSKMRTVQAHKLTQQAVNALDSAVTEGNPFPLSMAYHDVIPGTARHGLRWLFRRHSDLVSDKGQDTAARSDQGHDPSPTGNSPGPAN